MAHLQAAVTYFFRSRVQFLWSGEQITGAATILIACLDAIAIAFTNLTVIRLLAASGFVMSLTQWIASWRMRTEAFQVI